jgi:plastocyanin
MRRLTKTVLAISLGALPLTAWAQGNVSNSSQGMQVSGEIQLVQGKFAIPAKDASDAVVWLVPLVPIEPARLEASGKTYRMVQHHKQFEPHLLVVPVGSVVVFPNLDPWFHNVFSLYRGKRFDLGLYEAGSQKEVRFDRSGASYIFCNIHPEMMAVVLAVDTGFYAVSDRSGHWTISGVPVGRYRLRVWYENATPAALNKLSRVVSVGESGFTVAALAIPVTPHDWLNHTNLYGHKYDPKTLAPVY